MSAAKQVVLLIETSSQFGRSLLAGVSDAVRCQLDWRIYHAEFDFQRDPLAWLDTIRPDGIISRCTTPWLIDYAQRTETPVMELTESGVDHGLHGIFTDNEAIGGMAADYFLGRGFVQFAYCGHDSMGWSVSRRTAYVERLAERGFSCSVHLTLPPESHGGNPLLDQEIVDWLANASYPMAVFACNDSQATRVLRACQSLGLSVPEQVAVLGVDDDEVQRKLAAWPISSIEPGALMIGYQAAIKLASLMDGQPCEPRTWAVKPTSLVTRQSTDIFSLEDRELAAALVYVREHACMGITVQDVLDNVPMSRTALEKGFRRLLGRTPKEEIRRLQVDEVIRLLTDTDMPLAEIAGRCGFKHPEYMSVVVKRETGKTPGMVRNRASDTD